MLKLNEFPWGVIVVLAIFLAVIYIYEKVESYKAKRKQR